MPAQDNLDKQVKRHVIGPMHACYAVTPPGMEKICARELACLAEPIQAEAVDTGGVAFNARLSTLYQANLQVRTAGRFLLRLAQLKVTNFRQLQKQCRALQWAWFLPGGTIPTCKVTSHQSRLYHSQAVAQQVVEAIAAYWRDREMAPLEAPDQRLYLRLSRDVATLSLDSSGDPLYRRGLKTHGGKAPLRENIAAAILALSGYNPDEPLLDPMCGTGSFALEAALWTKRIPPGYYRDFAFQQWPSFRPKQWQYLKDAAKKGMRDLARPSIYASDVDAQACQRLTACITRHGLNDAVAVRPGDFFECLPPPGHPSGLIVLNPPYGLRLTTGDRIEPFYRQIGAKLCADFKGWKVALIVPHLDLIHTQPYPTTPISFSHGGLALILLTGHI